MKTSVKNQSSLLELVLFCENNNISFRSLRFRCFYKNDFGCGALWDIPNSEQMIVQKTLVLIPNRALRHFSRIVEFGTYSFDPITAKEYGKILKNRLNN